MLLKAFDLRRIETLPERDSGEERSFAAFVGSWRLTPAARQSRNDSHGPSGNFDCRRRRFPPYSFSSCTGTGAAMPMNTNRSLPVFLIPWVSPARARTAIPFRISISFPSPAK